MNSQENEQEPELLLGKNEQLKAVNTFTRWINEKLKSENKQIENLAVDLADGLCLICLVEILSGKKLPRYTKRPTFRPQKLENIATALKFLQTVEKIKIVNIDSSDIVDQNLKLILGLVWTLILHYGISIHNLGDIATTSTPKQRLLMWIQQKIGDEITIKNFTSDWNDGKALGALVDAVAPGLCPDWELWKKEDKEKNSAEAITLAQKWLLIPPLIQAEEVSRKDLDEKSMMTYLSQFPHASLQPGAPLRKRIKPFKVRVDGQGIDGSGVYEGEVSEFTVKTYGAGDGELDVIGEDASGKNFDIKTVFNNDNYQTYTCSYQPSKPGSHLIRVYFSGHEVPDSPFNVGVLKKIHEETKLPDSLMKETEIHRKDRIKKIDEKPSYALQKNDVIDLEKVVVGGNGVQPNGVNTFQETEFYIINKNPGGNDKVFVEVEDPSGKREVIRTSSSFDGRWIINYTPLTKGTYYVYAQINDQPLIGSPYAVHVTEKFDISHYVVSGRGIQPKGLSIKDKAEFSMKNTKGQTIDNVDVEVSTENGDKLQVLQNKIKPNEVVYQYTPHNKGRHLLNITVNKAHLDKSPYEVNVSEHNHCPVVAYGAALTQAVANKPATFCLESNGETGSLSFSIEGASKADIECLDNEDGSAIITFYPTIPGEYAVHVLCEDQDINGSPFVTDIIPLNKAVSQINNAKVYGDIFENASLVVDRPYTFHIDVGNVRAKDQLQVEVYNSSGYQVPIDLVHQTQNVTTYSFTPSEARRYNLLVSYLGVMLDQSPYKLECQEPSDPSKVVLRGPALEGPIISSQPSYLIVDCSLAGPGDVAIMLTDLDDFDVPMETEEYENNSFKVTFTPSKSVQIVGKVFFSEVEVDGSPINIEVKPPIDFSSFKITVPQRKKFINSPVDFKLAMDHLPLDDESVTAVCVFPSGVSENVYIERSSDGMLSGSFNMIEAGKNLLQVFYERYPVGEVELEGLRGGDASYVKVYGPGIESGWTNKPQTFTVETKGAGEGGLNVGVSGPSQVGVVCKDNRDGTCTVQYTASTRGTYQVAITFLEQHVTGSPFNVEIKDQVDFSKVKIDDFDKLDIIKGRKSTFHIDTRDAGESDVKVIISDAQGFSKALPLTEDQKGVYEAGFVPPNEGFYNIEVWFAGTKIMSNKVKVKPVYKPEKVKVYGDGISQNGIVTGKPTNFFVNYIQAGKAELSVDIEDHMGRPTRHNVSLEKNDQYSVTYVPKDIGHVNIRIKYGDEFIPGSPFVVPVLPAETFTQPTYANDKTETNGTYQNGDYGNNKPIDRHEKENLPFDRVSFNFPVGPILGFVQAKIETPSGACDVPGIDYSQQEDSITVNYLPKEIGEHLLTVTHDDQPLTEVSPIVFTVPPPSLSKVKASGAGLSAGFCRAACCFNISVDRKLQRAGIAVNIDGPSKAEIDLQEANEGFDVSYKVSKPGSYLISILYSHTHIQGSPFTANILPFYKDRLRSEMLIKPTFEEAVNLGLSIPNLNDVSCVVLDSSKNQRDVTLKTLPGGMLGAIVNVEEEGNHSFELTKAGKPLNQAAIQRYLFPKQRSNVDNVKVHGEGIVNPKCNQANYFHIDYINAGTGFLKVSMDGPSRVEMEKKENDDKMCTISFNPTNPGTYILTVIFANDHVLGSPFLLNVKGDAYEIEDENEEEREEHAYAATGELGKETFLHLAIPEDLKNKLNVFVVGPSGAVDSCYFKATPSSFNPSSLNTNISYSIAFVPKESGFHSVHVNRLKQPLPGSPYKFLVGSLSQSCKDILIYGDGLLSGYVNKAGTFTIDSSNAEDGNLTIVMEGVIKPEITFKDTRNGSCNVTYICSEPGIYLLTIKFNGDHVKGSPFAIDIKGDGNRNSTTSKEGEEEGVFMPRQPISLEILMEEEITSKPDAKITTPSKNVVFPVLQQIESDRYTIRFIPREQGKHIIEVVEGGSIKKNKTAKVLKKLEVFVGKKTSDPSDIKWRPLNGLEARTGERFFFDVDMSEAGNGALEIVVDGPSRVFIVCHPANPLRFHFEPQCPGIYKVQIILSGKLVPSNVFNVLVKGNGKPLPWNEISKLSVDPS